MHSESVIISAIFRFFKKLAASYEKSAYYKTFCRFLDFWIVFFGKIFAFVFSVSAKGKNSKPGIFSKAANVLPSFLQRILGKTVNTVTKKGEESFIVRIVSIVINSWYLIGVKNYAILFLAFTTVRLAVLRNIGRTNDKYSLGFFIVSVIGLLIPASFAGLYQGSLIRKQLGLSDLKDPSRLIIRIKPRIATTCCLVAGALLGLAVLLPYWQIFVLCILGIVFVLTKPYLSVLLITAVSPLVSKEAFFVLAIILAGVWLMRYLAKERPGLRFDGLDACMIFVVIAAICSALTSPVIKSSLGYMLIFILFAMFYFILRKAFTDKNNIRLFVDIMVILAGIIAFSQLYRLTFSKAVFDKDKFYLLHSMEQNLHSTTVLDKSFGELFIFVLPLALCRMKLHRAFFGKLMYLTSALLMSMCIVSSYEYYIPALVLAIFITVFTDFRKIASILIFPAVIFIGILIFRFVAGGFNFAEFIPHEPDYLPISGDLSSMLLYGVGLGKEALKSAYAFVFGQIPPGKDVMSLYTSILLASGVAGIIVFIAAMRTVFSYAGRAMHLSQEKNPLLHAFVISAVLFVFTGFIPTKTYCETTYMIFFTLASASGAMLDLADQKEVR